LFQQGISLIRQPDKIIGRGIAIIRAGTVMALYSQRTTPADLHNQPSMAWGGAWPIGRIRRFPVIVARGYFPKIGPATLA
jgi:hypothetical protein